MKKFLTVILSILCAATLVFACVACGNNNDDKKDDDKKEEEVVSYNLDGEYIIDGSSLGMPMQWYLKITSDNKFQISSTRKYENDKGNGSIGKSGETYVFYYSDSTNESAKVASFTVVNGNLIFSTALPIGTATLKSDDAENPVSALVIAYEDLLKEYVTTDTSQGVMGTTNYDISLELSAGRTFTYTSSFKMMGSTYNYIETGSFEVDGTSLNLTATKRVTSSDIETGALSAIEKPETITGTIENGTVSIGMKTSPMKDDRIDLVFETATTSEVSGEYTATKIVTMGPMECTTTAVLTLGKTGKYSYTNDFVMSGESNLYAEKGTFVVDGDKITFTPTQKRNEETSEYEDITADAIEGTKADKTITASMGTAGRPTEFTFYHESVCGSFAADDSSDSPEIVTYATLDLNADGTFSLKITQGENSNEITGTFEATSSTISLIYNEGAKTLVGMISSGKINVSKVPVFNDETAGFSFTAK